jgi:hypothetical protein
MAAAFRNLSGDPNFDLLVNYDDVSLKLTNIRCINRYPDRSVTARVVPVDASGNEDLSRQVSQTYAPNTDTTIPVPQNGANSVTLAFNVKGNIAGYDTYIDIGESTALKAP